MKSERIGFVIELCHPNYYFELALYLWELPKFNFKTRKCNYRHNYMLIGNRYWEW